MCCIFTCFGWMLDLVQRLWTFFMSCCICSAVCCLLIIAAMAGIALGYNYSLAEYIDLKESNVSIFLKRGIFDDEIADMQLRRAAEDRSRGLMRSGDEKSEIPDEKPVKSGRRLDDSVFDGGDQFRYEGSLMKLTAKPPFERSTTVTLTPDFEMASAISSYTRDTLDSLKAIQAVVDSRRAYAATIRGPTVSPVPTYPFNEVERYSINPEITPPHQELPAIRRMMPGGGESSPTINPARLAVPPKDIGEDINWVAPYRQEEYERKFKEMGLEPTGFTLPSAIHYNSGPIRPTPTTILTTGGLYLTKYRPVTLFSTRPTEDSEMGPYTKESKVLSFKEKLLAENERPRKPHKPSEDDYDYDVKGLPVRKRRSISDYKITDHKDADRISVKALANDKQLNVKPKEGNIVRNLSETFEVVILNDTYRAEHPILSNLVKLNNTSKQYLGNLNDSMLNKNSFELEHEATFLDKQNGSLFQHLFSHITRHLQMVKKGLSSFHYDRADESINNADTNIDNRLEEVPNNRNKSSKAEAEDYTQENKTQTGTRNFSSIKEMTLYPLFIKMSLPTLA